MSRKGSWFLHLGLSCALAGVFLPSNFIKLASLAFCAAYAFWPGETRPPQRLRSLASLLWIPIALGASRLLAHGAANALRDLAYFLIPPVYFAVGRRLQAEAADVQALIFRYAKWYGLVFLAGAAYQWNVHGFLDVTILRDFVSPGSFLLALCLFLLVKGRETWGGLLRTPLFLLSALVFTVQASRTYALALSVLFLTPRAIRISGRNVARMVGVAALGILLVSLVGVPRAVSDLAVKSIEELAIQDVWTPDDLGTRYRAYEAFAAYSAFASFSTIQKVVGAGFGFIVDLGVPVLLAGNEYDAVPWIHNGYLYVLVKAGVLGLLSYLAFFARLFSGSYPASGPLGPALVRGTVVGLLLSNLVVCGWFNIESVFAFVVLGYMFAVRVTACRPDGASKLVEPVLAGGTLT